MKPKFLSRTSQLGREAAQKARPGKEFGFHGHLYRGSLTSIQQASGISALTRPAARTFSLRLAHRLARSRPQQKNRATLRVLLLEPGRSSPILARPDAPGLDF